MRREAELPPLSFIYVTFHNVSLLLQLVNVGLVRHCLKVSGPCRLILHRPLILIRSAGPGCAREVYLQRTHVRAWRLIVPDEAKWEQWPKRRCWILKAANRIRAAMEPSFPRNPNEKSLPCFIRLRAGRGVGVGRASLLFPCRASVSRHVVWPRSGREEVKFEV